MAMTIEELGTDEANCARLHALAEEAGRLPGNGED
jgi:hypothetical protein